MVWVRWSGVEVGRREIVLLCRFRTFRHIGPVAYMNNTYTLRKFIGCDHLPYHLLSNALQAFLSRIQYRQSNG